MQTNESACSVYVLRFALCYSDAGAECGTPLAYEDLFAMGVAEVYVELAARHFSYSPLDAAHTLAALELRPNSTNDPNAYGAYVATDSRFNPLVEPRGDGYFDTTLAAQMSYVDAAPRAIADGSGGYMWRGAYGSRVTLVARDDAVVNGEQELTVEVGAYMYTISGTRYPTDGYIPKTKYFVASELPATVGGDRAAVSPTYAQTNKLNVSLAEAYTADVDLKGCGYCVTKEEDDTTFCTITVKLTGLPTSAVNFTASIVGLTELTALGRSVRARVRGGRRHVASRRTDRGDRRHERLSGDLHDRARGVG